MSKRAGLLAALAFTAAACGTTTYVHPTGTASVPPQAGDVRTQAAKVAAAWSASEAKQAWYDGYYPLDRSQEWLPAGFHGMADKAAYWSGHLDVPAASVTSPASGEVAWTDGSRLTVPLIPAAQLLHRLTNTEVQCSNHCDARLTVSAIRLGTRAVPTSRGQATIPVWELTVAGYDQPFVYPAVATPADQQTPPSKYPALGDATPSFWTATSADGRTLTGTVNHVPGDRLLPTEVYETADVVVLIGHVAHPSATPSPGGPLAASAAMVREPAEFRLAHPLGTRAVLNLVTGAPEPAPGPAPDAPSAATPQ